MINHDAAISMGASLQHAQGNCPCILDDPSLCWIVLSGSADVHLCRTRDDLPTGTRRSIGRASVGDAFFAVDSASAEHRRRLVLTADEDFTLLVVPLERFSKICSSIGVSPAAAIEGWVNKLSLFLAEGTPRAGTDIVAAEGEVRLEAGQMIRAERGAMVWVRVESGTVQWLDMSDVELDAGPAHLPITASLWLRASDRSKLKVTTDPDSDFSIGLPLGIAALHKLLLARLANLDEEERRADIARLEERGAVQRRQARLAMNAMASVLDPKAVIREHQTPLLGAMGLVGEALGVKIKAPPASDAVNVKEDPLEAIARASRIRYRRVILRGAWWKKDCGPLLAFRAENNVPVALLRDRSGYRIVDPDAGTSSRVDQQEARTLAPQAVMLYRRLPDSVTNPFQLLRFLLSGKSADVLLILALASMATLIGMLTPLATALIMDSAIPSADTRMLVELGLALLAAGFGATMFQLTQGFVSIRMGVASDSTAQSAVWDRLLNVRAPFFTRFSRGDLLSRVMAVSEVNRDLNGATVHSLLAALTSTLNLGLLAFFSIQLAMIAAVLAATVAAATLLGGYFIQKHMVRLMELRGKFFGLTVQLVRSVSKIRVAGAQQRAFTRWVSAYTEQLSLVQRTQQTEDYILVLNRALPLISAVLLFWIGVQFLVGGNGMSAAPTMSIGLFLAFNTALGTLLAGTTSLSMTVIRLLGTVANGKRIHAILEAEQEADESKIDPGKLAGGFALEHVDFRYVEGGRKILDDLCIRAEPGEFIALVGPSGSGKSTILRLLLGFETPESGTVAFDGQNMRGIDLTAIRRQLGVVLQSGRITAGSILENLSAGTRITLEEAWEAVEDAGLAEDVKQMPMGLHTYISEGGDNFSGGQRQRLLVARALVRHPKILFMDEATSALDNKTQAIVSKSLERRRVTRLVIAHRVSTIRQADRIYVLQHGTVVDSGRYEELASRDGLFAKMLTRQLS